MVHGRASRLIHPRPWTGIRYRSYSSGSSVRRVSAVDVAHDTIGIQYFKEHAFDAGKPLLMKRQRDSPARVPAIDKWFGHKQQVKGHSWPMTATETLEAFSMAHVPYELMYPQLHEELTGAEGVDLFIKSLESKRHDDKPTVEGALSSFLRLQIPREERDTVYDAHEEQRLLRFEGPLGLLLAALKYNSETNQVDRLRQLYIAQASLDDLPKELVKDLPTPDIVKNAGRGDIYASSLWLGLEPTYTPLHRDPNPNIFVQLCSSKVVRLLPPSQGNSVFRQVQMRLGRHGGNSRIRGAEMMEGSERKLLYEAIWEEPYMSGWQGAIQEVDLEPGDALFIPKGWWHSVKSGFDDGRLNGSVNWWFR